MLTVNHKLRSITHPLVASLQMRKDYAESLKGEDVLVIETQFPEEDTSASFDSYLMDLLLDLEDLKNEAEIQVGKIDRVDIRAH